MNGLIRGGTEHTLLQESCHLYSITTVQRLNCSILKSGTIGRCPTDEGEAALLLLRREVQATVDPDMAKVSCSVLTVIKLKRDKCIY